MAAETFKYQRKELELKSLLEITQAINENQPESVLAEIFKFTCLVHLNIKSLILYVLNDGLFEQKIQHGVKGDPPFSIDPDDIEVDKKSGEMKIHLAEEYSFGDLEINLPVYHKDKILAILLLTRKDKEAGFDLDFTKALSNILVVALENKRFARKQLEQEVVNREISIASRVQQMLFPAELPYNEEIKAQVTYFPFRQVGGDYYDLVIKNELVYFCVADVSGKGISAALLMSNFQATLRTLLRSNADMKTILHQLNYTLFENTQGERFITFFLGCFDRRKKTFTYGNAGHNPPLLCLPKEKECRELNAGTTILGAFEELPFLEIDTIKDVEQFYIHLYTDGVTEAVNRKDEEFGEERLKTLVNYFSDVEPKEFHANFIQEIQTFTGFTPLKDDLTLLSIKIE
ncbi:PP2C family protein-serine/threonine phosphatase [Algoriphagus sediminis]|uniref:PP2C family protein-serine/threonine phosphatase n=1 Tax=Algoriphagus sediminis TaxID=3057113 RepID=A0ABT7Y957_9BACT|nr:PP2C family protein-serine/threonine phosphatase [Algoriphagus sediminis]MDN3203038.1 PP2C family protein-serine/threonine phosphatase [Algoriphagus sediminis]